MTIETHVRYLKPARFDDRLKVHARCVDVRGARFRYEYVVERDAEAIADGWTGHACVDAVTPPDPGSRMVGRGDQAGGGGGVGAAGGGAGGGGSDGGGGGGGGGGFLSFGGGGGGGGLRPRLRPVADDLRLGAVPGRPVVSERSFPFGE